MIDHLSLGDEVAPTVRKRSESRRDWRDAPMGGPSLTAALVAAATLFARGLESELYDIVDRTAITYVPGLQRWVMFYGGDFAPAVRVDAYWNVSTWNPYQVMFLRTRLQRER